VSVADRGLAAYKTNHLRRGLGVLAGVAPLLLLGASLVFSVTSGNRQSTAALVVMIVAMFFAAPNFYLSFIRPFVFHRRGGSFDEYKHVSGIPIVGTVVVVVGAILGFGSALCSALGLVAMALDTGGSVWFLIATWRDQSLWDDPARSPT
jgi:hypothetical protein